MVEEQIAAQEIECARLRKLAHEASFAEYSMDHRGHTSIVNHTNAWASHGDAYVKACEKLARLRKQKAISAAAASE